MVKCFIPPPKMLRAVRSFKLDPTLRKQKYPRVRAINRRLAGKKPEIGKHSCPICKNVFEYTPQLDHCHFTGKTRKYLCIRCNTGMGKFFDSAVILRKAASYIDNYDDRFYTLKSSMLDNAKTNGGIVWSSAW